MSLCDSQALQNVPLGSLMCTVRAAALLAAAAHPILLQRMFCYGRVDHHPPSAAHSQAT